MSIRASLTHLRRPVVLVACGGLVLTSGCSTSPGSLEAAVRDKPGVVRVAAQEEDGDDALPFQRIGKLVRVRMDADASEAQIMTVFEEYRGDVDDGDVYGVDVVLAGPKRATLATGEDVHATLAMVRDLLGAQHDASTVRYSHEAYPALFSVERRLRAVPFDRVVEVADGYRDDTTLRSVTVTSGDFALVRDADNDNLTLAAARQRFVQGLPSRLRVSGAYVGGGGPLVLSARFDRLRTLRHYLRDHTPRAVRRVVVRYRANM